MSSKPKLKPLAAALKLVDQLSDDEKLTLHDYLRPERKASKSPSTPAQPAAGRSSRKPKVGGQAASTATGTGGAGIADGAKEPICGTCGNPEGYVDHSQPSPNYHAFETSKAAGVGGE